MSSGDCLDDCEEAVVDDDVSSDNGKVGCRSEDTSAEIDAKTERDDEEELVDCDVDFKVSDTRSSSKRTQADEASFCTGADRILSR